MMTTTTLSSLQSPVKPRSNNNDDNYDGINDDKDVMIASSSKNNDKHNIVFFALDTVAILEADKGVSCLHRCPLTLMPSRRRRGGDPLLSKPQSTKDNKDNDTLIASMSKNNEDHVRS
jgi:hypothetical protein